VSNTAAGVVCGCALELSVAWWLVCGCCSAGVLAARGVGVDSATGQPVNKLLALLVS
jgi:hypothetical protein